MKKFVIIIKKAKQPGTVSAHSEQRKNVVKICAGITSRKGPAPHMIDFTGNFQDEATSTIGYRG